MKRNEKHFCKTSILLGVALLAVVGAYGVAAEDAQEGTYNIVSFEKITLADKFLAEGAGVGDFNHDGIKDVAIGSQWYEGPEFKVTHPYRQAKSNDFDPADYSDTFNVYGIDINNDGWDDILHIGLPGTPAHWYENPKTGDKGANANIFWEAHEVHPWIGNESPTLIDVVGDEKPELLFNIGGFLGYADMRPKAVKLPWVFHKISNAKGCFVVYTHGVGAGDINHDGRKDIVEALGWWEQPESLKGNPVWKFHKFKFAEGGAQMLVTDVNGDGLNDVVTVWHPHKYGLLWWEQTRNDAGEIDFIRHDVMGEKEEDSQYGVKFTQAHALTLADIDGDGLQDLVVGKRWWAHKPPIDPECDAPSVLYWWKLQRNPDGTADNSMILES